eukprot:1178965-Prorocentrum_minimum.AAC.1
MCRFAVLFTLTVLESSIISCGLYIWPVLWLYSTRPEEPLTSVGSRLLDRAGGRITAASPWMIPSRPSSAPAAATDAADEKYYQNCRQNYQNYPPTTIIVAKRLLPS